MQVFDLSLKFLLFCQTFSLTHFKFILQNHYLLLNLVKILL